VKDLDYQEAQIQFENTEPAFYERMPAIIDYLTYIHFDENKKIYTRRRLTPLAKDLYRILKQKAGSGACWASMTTLSKQVGVSDVKTLRKARTELENAFEQLNGLPLIFCQERRIKTKKDDQIINTRPNIVITLMDIWKFNAAFMSFKEYEFPELRELITKNEAEYAIEKIRSYSEHQKLFISGGRREKIPHAWIADGKISPEPMGAPGKISPQIKHTHKQDPNVSYKQNPPAEARIVMLLRQFCFLNMSSAKMFSWLLAFGISEKMAIKLVEHTDLVELCAAVEYFKEKYTKIEMKSPQGYLMQVVEKKWYKKYEG